MRLKRTYSFFCGKYYEDMNCFALEQHSEGCQGFLRGKINNLGQDSYKESLPYAIDLFDTQECQIHVGSRH